MPLPNHQGGGGGMGAFLNAGQTHDILKLGSHKPTATCYTWRCLSSLTYIYMTSHSLQAAPLETSL